MPTALGGHVFCLYACPPKAVGMAPRPVPFKSISLPHEYCELRRSAPCPRPVPRYLDGCRECGPKAGPLPGTRCGPANEAGRVRPSRSNNQRGDSVTRLMGTLLLTGFVACLGTPARAEGGKDAGAVIDKAIKALGGAEKLGAAKAFSWKSKGMLTFGGDDNKISADTTVQGHDHYRTEVQ